jgi:hypothetical protein
MGGLISWLIHNRQNKTAEKQDFTLEKIKELNLRHDKILKSIESIEKHNEATLQRILSLEKRIAELVKTSTE